MPDTRIIASYLVRVTLREAVEPLDGPGRSRGDEQAPPTNDRLVQILVDAIENEYFTFDVSVTSERTDR